MAVIDPIKNPFRVDVTGRIISALGLPTADFKINPPEKFGLREQEGKLFLGETELTGVSREGNQFFAMSDSPYQTDPSFLTLGQSPGQFESSEQVRQRIGAPSAGPGLTPEQIRAGFQTTQTLATSTPGQRTLVDIYQSRPDIQAEIAKSFPGQ